MHTADSTPSSSVSPEPRGPRRGLLLASACALLAIGVGVNAHRYTQGAEAPLELEAEYDESSDYDGPRFAAAADQSPPGSHEYDEAGGQGQRHKGEEGKMGKPSSRQKSGFYAMKGPANAIPQMARNFDPEMVARNAGILGTMSQQSGHFLASPYGAAFAVGNDDADVWGGIGGPAAHSDPRAYDAWVQGSFISTAKDARSTFSIDVDTGSYTLMRRSVTRGALPQTGSVRVEEMINYFDYEYPEPSGEVPMSISSEVGPCPWDEAHRLVQVGLQGKHVAQGAIPPRNLIFLVDVSGSMGHALPLVVSSLAYLTEQLGEQDRIGIVVYAGAAGTVLPPTVGTDKRTILGALERLEAGGSTNGGQGIELAYRLAEQHFVEGGVNRVMLATDGDFNVGVTGQGALVELIERKRRSGVFLSVLGFGGSNYQDGTMEQLADKGNGNYAYIDGLAEARKVLVEQSGATLQTIAKDVKIQVDFDPEVVESYRLVGYTNRVLADRDFADDTKDAGEIGAGHTVTAMYEIEPKEDAEDAALMELKLRYKDPDGSKSKLVRVPVSDGGADLAQTSDDFRFSAAVAGFGQNLQNMPSKSEAGSLESLRNLAHGARGADRQCRRAELVGLIERASMLRGQPFAAANSECTPTDERGPRVYDEPLEAVDGTVEPAPPADSGDAVANGESDQKHEPLDWKRFIIEVLYLLPPLLAMPLFVMALRRPRRRRD